MSFCCKLSILPFTLSTPWFEVLTQDATSTAPDTAFLTVTISSLTSPISPGDDDTYFPFQIAQGFKRLVDADENTDSLLPPENWLFFLKRTQEMSLGEWNQPWWKI